VPQKIILVLSGGVALGAYQAGAYAALHRHAALQPHHLAGSSIGAVNCALIAGAAPEERIARLQAFWSEAPLESAWLPVFPHGPWRHAYSWLNVMQTRLFGRAGQFRPRGPELLLSDVPSVYDLAPLRAQLAKLVDFERINRGTPRMSVVATDIESGDEVVFDTQARAEITTEHLLASCGFLPDFPPLEINGRLLGDGGLVANAPVESALDGAGAEGEVLCFVVDLFSARGERPATIEDAAARRWDLLFGNQTRTALRRLERQHRLSAREHRVKIVYLAYRAPRHEAGPEKPFDYSRASLRDRWDAGYRDMEQGIRLSAGSDAQREGPVSLSVW
jgi:NTE family protein